MEQILDNLVAKTVADWSGNQGLVVVDQILDNMVSKTVNLGWLVKVMRGQVDSVPGYRIVKS